MDDDGTNIVPIVTDPYHDIHPNWAEGQVDSDNDGVPDDGDASGVVGDNFCTGGNTVGCDDNCPLHYNPDQLNSDDDQHGGDVCDDCPSDPTSWCGPISGGCSIGVEGGECTSSNDSITIGVPPDVVDKPLSMVSVDNDVDISPSA